MKLDPHASAFARPPSRDGFGREDGLTIRAYIASEQMAALLSSSHRDYELHLDDVAKTATQAADALIAELNKAPTP